VRNVGLSLSVDAKKKELIGEFKNNGQEWHKKSKPTGVYVYDTNFELKSI